MSITINGTTNTLTAASGLTVAGNTAVTGTLSAGVASFTSLTTVASSTVRGTNGTYAGGALLIKDATNAYTSSILNAAGVLYLSHDTTGASGVMALSSTGLAVTGTLSASGVTSVTDTTDATSTTAASLKTAGGLGVAKKTYCGDNIVMSSGKGIDFSATSNGSGTTTSEVLSDYEEGTWTGTLDGVTTGPTTPVTATGQYTKIGRLVTVDVRFAGVDLTGASGGIRITGLPFTVGTLSGQGTALVVGTGATTPYAAAIAGTAYILVLESLTGSSVAVVAAAGKSVQVTITYHV